jgi:hypothetical protein
MRPMPIWLCLAVALSACSFRTETRQVTPAPATVPRSEPRQVYVPPTKQPPVTASQSRHDDIFS